MQYIPHAKASALAALMVAASAHAAPLPPLGPQIETVFSGDTTNASTYNRLCVGTIACGNTNYPGYDFPAKLSGLGTAVRYVTTEFEVTQQGTYTFFSASTNWDNYTFLYRNTFTPSDPFINLVTGNDDLTGINIGTGPFMNTNNHSGFSAVLDVGSPYVMVTTGLENFDYGEFVNSITGPAAVNFTSAVPEPGSDAMLALGLAGLGFIKRRRKSPRPHSALSA